MSLRYFILLGLSTVTPLSSAQSPGEAANPDLPGLPLEKFGIQQPTLPEIQPQPSPSPGLTLPPIEADKNSRKKSASPRQLKVFVREIRLTGHTAFSAEELKKVTAPFEGRPITTQDLQEVRHRLTRYYVDRGYINSGAVIPDQRIDDGIVRIHILEGELTEIDLTGNQWLRSGYINGRIRLASDQPLNVNTLQERLQLLQQNPLIDRINAELGPGIRPGQGRLKVDVEEARPYQMGATFSNNRSPSVGALSGEIWAAHYNLTGFGDTLWASFNLTEGVEDVSAYYAVPLTARNTLLKLYMDRSDADVIEEPFDDLDIESRTRTYGIALSHPVYQTPRQTLSLTLRFERRRSETFLQGERFSFSPGVQNGKSDVSVLRISQEWVDRSLRQVLAVRSTFNIGLDLFGATVNDDAPDGRFFAWLGQFQWLRRLDFWDSQLLIRSDLQLAADALLPLEKFSVGGLFSVRGYRENQLVRDNGWVSSVEFRVPVLRLPIPGLSKGMSDGMVQLAAFTDFGWSWNTDGPTPSPKTITSAGLGLRWDPSRHLQARFYWGYPFRKIENAEHNLQDSGIHFLVSTFFF
ncbi:MAG: ShlB/FhaC/HecB family hemolysin secretion/activation protein [Methylothermaceae bacterium]|nr:ShlB/FhaC/HecB family hemolysin secretion/activation protein [Methylothermaceae bacterium]